MVIGYTLVTEKVKYHQPSARVRVQQFNNFIKINHVSINYIQQCSIVQLCIPRKLEAFCIPDVGGHVISREFSRDVQLTNIARCM